jgi:hypothetical protein
MQKTYIKQYVRHFDLYQSGNKFYDKNAYHVLSVVNENIHYRVGHSEWKICNQGDLIVSIINNIPLHTI